MRIALNEAEMPAATLAFLFHEVVHDEQEHFWPFYELL
jgi:hypothetical protein